MTGPAWHQPTDTELQRSIYEQGYEHHAAGEDRSAGMIEPQMKAECAVSQFNMHWRWINFNATADAASAFEKFGHISPPSWFGGQYTVYVDARYDLLEVVAYINAYGIP